MAASPAPGWMCSCRSRRPRPSAAEHRQRHRQPAHRRHDRRDDGRDVRGDRAAVADHLRWRRAAAPGEPRGVAALRRPLRRTSRLPPGRSDGCTEMRGGLLLAMMEPPPAMEEEFQDWYDTEHFPERADCEGFLTAAASSASTAGHATSRCMTWRTPTCCAAPATRRSQASAIRRGRIASCRGCGGNIAPTPRRCIPGTALLGDSGCSGTDRAVALPACTADRGAVDPRRACGRCMRIGRRPRSCGCSAPISLTAPTTSPSSSCARRNGAPDSSAAFGDAARYVDLFNVYVPYARRLAGAFPRGT